MSEQRIIAARARGEIAAKRYRVDIHSGAHDLIADEPGPAGRGEEGPSSYDLLDGALAREVPQCSRQI